MIKAADLSATAAISNPEVRQLVEQRIDSISTEGFDMSEVGYFLVVEPGDTLDALAGQLGFVPTVNRRTGKRFDDPQFTPHFECVLDHGHSWEVIYLLSDSDGAVLLLPKADGLPPELSDMCQMFAISSHDTDAP
nr:hypothetical protein [uncultured Rhodoferax sp.]